MNSQKAQIFWTSVVAVAVALMALHHTFTQSNSSSAFTELNNRTPTSDLVGGSEFH